MHITKIEEQRYTKTQLKFGNDTNETDWTIRSYRKLIIEFKKISCTICKHHDQWMTNSCYGRHSVEANIMTKTVTMKLGFSYNPSNTHLKTIIIPSTPVCWITQGVSTTQDKTNFIVPLLDIFDIIIGQDFFKKISYGDRSLCVTTLAYNTRMIIYGCPN